MQSIVSNQVVKLLGDWSNVLTEEIGLGRCLHSRYVVRSTQYSTLDVIPSE